MKATVVKLNLYLPSCEARTRNEIIIAFRPPVDGSIRLSDELEFDLERIDTEQDVINFRTGQTIRVKVEKQNVHDVKLPGGHGTSRFPALIAEGAAQQPARQPDQSGVLHSHSN
jgi:hypothetical protein